MARNKGAADQMQWLVWGVPSTATGMSQCQPKGATLPDGSRQISASGEVYRGPGTPPPVGGITTPRLFALDTAGRSTWGGSGGPSRLPQ